MFAVIKTGGKQYRVVADDQFTIERVAGAAGDSVSFAEVLMVGTTIGAPFVAGASVVGEIVDQVRGPKVISFKKRRRQNSKRTRGHRQDLTLIRISEILTDGKAPSQTGEKAAQRATAEDETMSDSAPQGEAQTDEKPKRASAKAKAETKSAAIDDAATAKEAGEAKKPRAAKKKAESDEA